MHLSAKDLTKSCSLAEAQTAEFILSGHMIKENPRVGYRIACPERPQGQGNPDAMCTVEEVKDANMSANEVRVIHFIVVEELCCA